MGIMQPTAPLPASGEVFLDERGGGRVLRVSWHSEVGVVVLSLWRGSTCAGTFRLNVEDVPAMTALLRDGLATAYDDARAALSPGRHRADRPARDRNRPALRRLPGPGETAV
jgi:hypothetical protein